MSGSSNSPLQKMDFGLQICRRRSPVCISCDKASCHGWSTNKNTFINLEKQEKQSPTEVKCSCSCSLVAGKQQQASQLETTVAQMLPVSQPSFSDKKKEKVCMRKWCGTPTFQGAGAGGETTHLELNLSCLPHLSHLRHHTQVVFYHHFSSPRKVSH